MLRARAGCRTGAVAAQHGAIARLPRISTGVGADPISATRPKARVHDECLAASRFWPVQRHRVPSKCCRATHLCKHRWQPNEMLSSDSRHQGEDRKLAFSNAADVGYEHRDEQCPQLERLQDALERCNSIHGFLRAACTGIRQGALLLHEEDMRSEVMDLLTVFIRKTPSPLPDVCCSYIYKFVGLNHNYWNP